MSVADDDNARGAATGPRTAEGKRISSRNARTHGLTAKRPSTEHERGRLEAKVRAYLEGLDPRGEHETDLAVEAAEAAWRKRLCAEATIEAIDRNVDQALRSWEDRARHRVRKRAGRLAGEPDVVVEQLEASAFGCDWLLRHWRALLGKLDETARWTPDEVDRFFHLGGRPASRPPDEDGEGRRLFLAVLSLGLMPGPVTLGPGPEEPGARMAFEGARAVLRAFIAEQIARLEARRAEAWEECEAVEVRAVAAEGAIDISRDGMLRRRYEREADLSLNRNLSLLHRMQQARRKAEAEENRPKIIQETGRVPKLIVGGGWYREKDAAEAPPGFVRASAVRPPAHPPRNEPPAAAPGNPGDGPNSRPRNEMRDASSDVPAGDDRRTGGVPGPLRGAPEAPPDARSTTPSPGRPPVSGD